MAKAKIISCFLIASMFLMAPSYLAFSQEVSEIATKEVEGTIIALNLEGSSLIIRQPMEEGQSYKDITIYVDESTDIQDYNGKIGISELKVDSKVSIEYTTDKAGGNTAVYIYVSE